MRKLGLLFFIIPAICSGQVVFDFEKNNLSGWVQCMDSAWDTSSLDAISGHTSLAHVFDNPESGHDQTGFLIDSLRPDLGRITWEFTIHHSYNPSSANNWGMFLVSDSEPCEMHPKGNASGYVIGVNYHGSDDLLKLWRVTGGRGTVLIESQMNWQEEVGTDAHCQIKVVRDTDFQWIVYYRPGVEEDWVEAGDNTDKSQISPVYSGLYYEYSSKQDMKLRVDDIRLDGVFLQDTVPPSVDSIIITGSRELIVRFSEVIDLMGTIGTMNFLADHDIGQPVKVEYLSGNEVQLTFANPFPDRVESTLLVSNVADLKGNIMKISRHYFIWIRPALYDVVFNELMIDPTPSMGLSAFEFIELYNRGDHPVSLLNWRLECNKYSMLLPDRLIDTGSYLLLIHEDAAGLFPDSLNILPVLRSKTILKNEGGTISLFDADGRMIEWIFYDEDWHGNEYFSDGGWSLERIDPDRFCGGSSNWETSGAVNGGTPGYANSVLRNNPDTIRPEVTSIVLPENDVIQVFYSEPMDSAGMAFAPHYEIVGFDGMISGISLDPPEYKNVLINLDKELNRDSVLHIEISQDIRDCSANSIVSNPVRFAVPDYPDSGDIVINEIMFDPLPGGYDFVELYNVSSSTYDLSDLLIANRDNYTDSVSSVKYLYDGLRLFFPQEYLLFTENISRLLSDFPDISPDNWIEVSDLPTYGDKSGTVVLLNRWYEIIDEFNYHSEMHFPLLASSEGVSLERIDPIVSTNNRNNWHSAAEDVGFATPGYMNSQGMELLSSNHGIRVEPEIFSPDNDGIDDFISIKYNLDHPGSVITVWIFNPLGSLICQLADNQLLGTKGLITWDGTDHLGRRVNTGIYLVYIQLFTLDGQVREVKKTCVLSGRNR